MATTMETRSAPVGTWTLDPVHSTVGFEIAYLAGTFKGQFRDVEARLAIGEAGASLEGSARVASVDVKDENLAAHLQSPDFFDAENHPELRFAARDVAIADGTATVEGEITIKGVTRPVLLTGTVAGPLADPYGNERLGLAVSTTVDRTEFGVSWNNPLPGGELALANEVRIVAELAFVRS
jgi:polyisoprenoid-binding protein YceI